MIGPNGSFPKSVREAAEVYLGVGLLPVSVPFRQKKPVRTGWPDLRPTLADLDNLFPRGTLTNIGGLLGTPSGNIVDIDLDCCEAVGAAPLLLPATGWLSGRAGKPRSHYWFRTDNPPTKAEDKLRDLDGTCMLELRSTRAQTVLPPSVHESGELVEWHAFSEPAELPIDELQRAFKTLAAGTILSRHWPERGSLHDARLALAGGLARAGWKVEQIDTFIKAVTVAAGNEGLDDAERVGADTLRRLDEGKDVWGWPTLAELLKGDGSGVVTEARKWLGCRESVVEELPFVVELPWPDSMAPEAFHGLAGDIVRALEPTSEADPAALLVQTLIGFGNIVGRTAHFSVEADRHFANEFIVLIGQTSKARKGTSWGQINRLLCAAEEQWAKERCQTGLSSGEGLIWAVRDPIQKRERIKEKGQPVRYEDVEADPGIEDKRLLVAEPEFAQVLKQTERQGNTLSAILRQAWESGDLRTLTKNNPARSTGAHVSLIGHITAEELRRYLSTTEAGNGFGNRMLWVCVRRSKSLPEGGRPPADILDALAGGLAEALAFAKSVGEMRRDAEAREIWHSVYSELSEGKPGLSGALLGRGEAHVMRLGMIYALLDRSSEIGGAHLLAALAVWDYVERSVRYVFGDTIGDPFADELLRLLRSAPQGLSRTDLRDYFGRNQSGERIARALGVLLQHGRARIERKETGGRPSERWFATKG